MRQTIKNHIINVPTLLLSLTLAGGVGLVAPWVNAGLATVDPQRGLRFLAQVVRWEVLFGTLLLSCLLLMLAAGRLLMQSRQRTAERLQRTLLHLGEARGRQAVLDEVRMLEHAQLKAHVMATQRCLLQAQAADDPGEIRRWVDAGTAQVTRLLQVVVGLHHAAGDSALPSDLEQTARDTVASLAVAYPHCTCTIEVCGPRPTAIDDIVQRAVVLMLYNALHNAYTHGHPSAVQVQVQYAPDALMLVVRDNGRGGASLTHAGAGRGLRDIEHLAARCGGVLRIESNPTCGTVVTATVPLIIEGGSNGSLWPTLAAQSDGRVRRSAPAALAERGNGAGSRRR
ncbi:MAG: sensor histidine kinase [Oscillochloridaceae bacterium umkhey_bin13]